MTAEILTELIYNGLFPIACVIALAWYIYTNNKEQREDRRNTNEILLNFAMNIQANTNALEELKEYIKNTTEKDK